MKFERKDFHGYGEIRTAIDKDGQAWFVVKDVCDILGIKNDRDAISKLNKKQKGVGITDTLGGNQEMNIISEGGLYKLAFTSRKPIAQEFTDWVTDELIPEIRKQLKKEVFDMFSKDTQKEAMSKLKEHDELDKKIYTIANKMVNAIVSEIRGFDKPLNKDEMPEDMVAERQKVLDEWVRAYKVSLSKSLANHIVRNKYDLRQVGKYKNIK